MDASNAKRNQQIGLDILDKTLTSLGHLPKRNFLEVEDFKAYFAEGKELIIDATEPSIQRPSAPEKQNGSTPVKKSHTIKSMIISSNNKRISYISPGRIGKLHDYRFLQEAFPPAQGWFKDFKVKVDLGYLGIAKDYICQLIRIPHKKKKNLELTEPQQAENKLMAAERIGVEHSLAGLKRYRILSDRLRLPSLDLYDQILGICAGWWNFYLSDFS